ncbi:Fanconi anemia group D2 protein-like [Mytilus galloprovincialis]|uniref:Fanconi anemia group D2 protein-like n=1 Tax=Mytilus galloprovincialis TaxID=29158 RepID=UPI003F7C21FB
MVAERNSVFSKKRKTSGEHGDEKIKGGQKKRKGSEDEDIYQNNSTFCELVNKAGLTLMKGNKPNSLGFDQAVFQRNLQVSLKRHESYPEVLDEFVEGFQEYIEDQKRLHNSLVPTFTASECDSARSVHQDCLVRLLLGVDLIQTKLMHCLLEKLAEFTEDDQSIFEHGEKVNIPRLLMSQFRWLDRILAGKEITEKMVEMIGIVTLDVQREIISCLPEVVEDSEHGDVATALRDLLSHNTQLTVPILDSLANLNLTSELLAEVRGTVLKTLHSAEVEELPVIIKFLLQSVNNQDAVEVVSEIRANLDFSTTFRPPISSTPHQSVQRNRDKRLQRISGDVNRGAEALTLDAIKSSIRFQKCVAEACVKAIDGIKQPGDHKVIDIFLLLILHSTNRKKPVESLVRNKIRAGGITEVLLQDIFTNHNEVLREFFPSILSLAEVLLRSPEPAVSYIACTLYTKAFVAFDSFCQQEIVGNLVTHIGSGFESEIDHSLDILSELVEHYLTKMAPFAIFVKGVLDYLDNLSVMQIRKLYSMLSILAFRNPNDGGMIQDDLHIIIRKQLSNNSPKYKRMGIIGAIMIVKSIAYNSKNGQSGLTEESYKQVVALLNLVRTSINRIPEAAALFMDELANVIQKGCLDPKVEAWIDETVISDFQGNFVLYVDESPKDECLTPGELQYNLDPESEEPIAIYMSHLVEKSAADKKKSAIKDSSSESGLSDPLCLSPHFRLLYVCESRQQEDLSDINALLGCPVFLPKPEVYEKLEPLSQKEKEFLCDNLFLSLNWFREVINGFATQTDPEMKAKVISRLHNITDLQRSLEKCLNVQPSYSPLPAHFDWYEAPKTVIQNTATTTEGKKKKTKKASKKKADSNETTRVDDSDESSKDSTHIEKDSQNTQITENKDGNSTSKSGISLQNYRPFFREINMEVFTILNTGMITVADLDTEQNTKATTELSIQPPQLEFLLEDLACKLSHSLIASASKKKTFLKQKTDKNIGFSHIDQLTPKEVATKAVKLLPALCNHLEAASGFFQTMIAENDGMIDGPGFNSPESSLMASCFQLILQTMCSLFSWNGFLMSDNKSLFKEGLGTLVSRIKTTSGSTQISRQDLIKTSFQYIKNFADMVPNIATAVSVVKLLTVLADKSDSRDLHGQIPNICEEFLKREWMSADGQKEKGVKYNENLQIIIRAFMVYSDDPLSAAETIATKGMPELLETDKNGCSATFPTLNRSSFSTFYRVMFNQLIDCIKTMSPAKQTDSREVKIDKLLQWNQAVRILHIHINLIKAFDGRGNVTSALKCGRQFIEIFLRQGMPLLDTMFRTNREDVQGLLKNLQISTRYLHHMCGHSKIMKDVCLTNLVPLMKKCLEAFVYRVKAMLTMNKCLEAFWLGNLKNRDLQGEEILSQTSAATDDQGSDDEAPEEDQEESDVEMDNQSEAGDQTNQDGDDSDGQSCSETF